MRSPIRGSDWYAGDSTLSSALASRLNADQYSGPRAMSAFKEPVPHACAAFAAGSGKLGDLRQVEDLVANGHADCCRPAAAPAKDAEWQVLDRKVRMSLG